MREPTAGEEMDYARQLKIYRASIWGIRTTPLVFVPLLFGTAYWPLMFILMLVVLGLTIPFQIYATWDLNVTRGWVTMQQLADVFNPRFR